MSKEEIEFWTMIAEVSPVLAILIGFIALLVLLNKWGLLEFKDASEEKWRREMETTVSDLRSRVSHLEGYIEGKK